MDASNCSGEESWNVAVIIFTSSAGCRIDGSHHMNTMEDDDDGLYGITRGPVPSQKMVYNHG